MKNTSEHYNSDAHLSYFKDKVGSLSNCNRAEKIEKSFKYDISWIRTPIMAVGALVVAYVFYQNAKKQKSNQSGSFGGGGLPKGFDLDDFKKFVARYEGSRGGGGGDRVGDGTWRGG